jgi:hypothetical protein
VAIKHLESRGFKVNPLKVSTEPDEKQHRIAGAITGRRARKEWPCAAEDCDLRGIEWDEVYVEATDPGDFKGRHKVKDPKRYHLLCAIRHELIVKDESKTEVINRRGAIAMTKANAKVFAEALANPPEPNAALRKAAEKYTQAIEDGELEIVE